MDSGKDKERGFMERHVEKGTRWLENRETAMPF